MSSACLSVERWKRGRERERKRGREREESCPMVRILILFRKHGPNLLQTKEERDYPACYQFLFLKTASLLPLEWTASTSGNINAERYAHVFEQHVFKGRPFIFQQHNAKLYTGFITKTWLQSRRFQVFHWPVCSPDPSPIKTIWHFMKEKICQRRHKYCWLAWAQHSSPKTPETGLVSSFKSMDCCKEQRMLDIGKHLNTALLRFFVTCWSHKI